jgi:hypothetical protein
VEIGHPRQIKVVAAKIFATDTFMITCCRWNEKETAEKTRENFKAHFAAAHLQHKQMQRESASNSGYHAANAAVGQTEDQMAEPPLALWPIMSFICASVINHDITKVMGQ